MKLDNSLFWLGSEASMREVLDAQIAMRGMTSEETYPETSRLLSVEDGLAIIKVEGSLTNEDSYFNALFGITSYTEIRNAIHEAISDGGVNRITLQIDSGGGSAKGIEDLSNFIKLAKTHKPIDTYIAGSAFSAAYWIASATDKIYGAKMSEAGSIGVISVLINQADAMKEQGYEVTVFRGGKYKALGNPYEKLTDTAKEIYQDKINIMENFFLDAVAENRNIPRQSVKAQVGEGLTFFAEQSVSNGLMDEVISFDSLIPRLIKQGNNDSGDRLILVEDIDMKKKVLTEEAVAQLAAGVPEDKVKLGDAPEVKAEDETPEADKPEDAPEVKAEDDKGSTIEAYLKAELAELKATNADLMVKASMAEDKAKVSLANESPLKEIVNTFIGNMSIGLGIKTVNMSNMDTSTLLAQYAEVRAEFTNHFKIGAEANVEDDEPEASSGASLSLVERVSAKANKI